MRGWLKDIPGFEGRYAVDMGGNVYSYHKGDYLKPGIASGGHLTVSLGSRNSRSVHELMLTTFVGPRPSPNHVTRHIDGDHLHNCILNLEWATYSRNAQDKKWHSGQRTYKLSGEDVVAIKELLAMGHTLSWIGAQYGVGKTTISAIKTGRNHRDV